MTISHKLRKKKVVLPAISIIQEEEKLYAKVYHFNQDTIHTNHVFFQTPKQKLVKIFQSKRKTFCMKATIWKLNKNTKYALSNSHVKSNQGSDLIIINSRLIK